MRRIAKSLKTTVIDCCIKQYDVGDCLLAIFLFSQMDKMKIKTLTTAAKSVAKKSDLQWYIYTCIILGIH